MWYGNENEICIVIQREKYKHHNTTIYLKRAYIYTHTEREKIAFAYSSTIIIRSVFFFERRTFLYICCRHLSHVRFFDKNRRNPFHKWFDLNFISIRTQIFTSKYKIGKEAETTKLKRRKKKRRKHKENKKRFKSISKHLFEISISLNRHTRTYNIYNRIKRTPANRQDRISSAVWMGQSTSCIFNQYK